MKGEVFSMCVCVCMCVWKNTVTKPHLSHHITQQHIISLFIPAISNISSNLSVLSNY